MFVLSALVACALAGYAAPAAYSTSYSTAHAAPAAYAAPAYYKAPVAYAAPAYGKVAEDYFVSKTRSLELIYTNYQILVTQL